MPTGKFSTLATGDGAQPTPATANVRAFWVKEDVTAIAGAFGRELPLYGSEFYRISPVR